MVPNKYHFVKRKGSIPTLGGTMDHFANQFKGQKGLETSTSDP